MLRSIFIFFFCQIRVPSLSARDTIASNRVLDSGFEAAQFGNSDETASIGIAVVAFPALVDFKHSPMVWPYHYFATAPHLLVDKLRHQRGHVDATDEVRVAFTEQSRRGVDEIAKMAEMNAVVEFAEYLHAVVRKVRAKRPRAERHAHVRRRTCPRHCTDVGGAGQDARQPEYGERRIVRMDRHVDSLVLQYRRNLVEKLVEVALERTAVKEIVYEKNEMSLADLGKIMAANWAGHEKLRLRMFRSKRKWGNNDAEANALGAVLIDCYAEQLNGKPNSRGGVFLASGHCARQYIGLGKRTGATPDGRKAGEEMSKNLSPVMGVDTEGATALIATLSVSDVTKLPADYPLDVMLHPSVCAGDRGLMLMKTLVRQYHRNGGSVIQFTVFSEEELRDAQKHPEKYENLQVRVCGWNVRWNDMTKEEQDAYIRRAENIMR